MIVSTLKTLLYKFQSINQAKQIHAQIILYNLNHLQTLLIPPILSSSGLNSYSPMISKYVQQILLSSRNPDDTFYWSITIRHLSQHGQFKEALRLYISMHGLGICFGTFVVTSALRACARIMCKIGGIAIHGQVIKYGFCGDVYVETALMDVYCKLGDMENAKRVFDEMRERNVVSWNSFLAGYIKCEDLVTAKSVFDEIPEKDIVSWNSMVSGYARARDMDMACSLFNEMPDRNSASWNAIICGNVDCGKMELARRYFDAMPQRNNVSWITMISGYAKFGDVDSARGLFDQMSQKDLFLFNAMIACYAQNSKPKEALELFNEMIKSHDYIFPDKMTLASVISACSQLGDIRFGSWTESYMNKHGIEMDDHLATALIDLYAKSGSIVKASELFYCLKKKDLIAYSTMILGCGLNGMAVDAIRIFEEMLDAHICPNLVTFNGLLTALNHAGLVEEGYLCLNSMKAHGFVPSADHYAIMVDLLGRAGRLEEAHDLIKGMPVQPHAGVWGALLLACSQQNNVDLGEISFKHCSELEPEGTGYSSLLASIYASVGRWGDAKILKENGLSKIPGCSWMDSG